MAMAYADVAKSVDAADLKSASPWECGFKSRRPHQRAMLPLAFAIRRQQTRRSAMAPQH
ncbi:hypothetical protein SKA58_10480 [Sphingomonas sp. SKA58]|nr:hypothetical protein SKA58_10480 [Sphingomonas sp. SKA58]